MHDNRPFPLISKTTESKILKKKNKEISILIHSLQENSSENPKS